MNLLVALLLGPLLPGVARRTMAWFAGRQGPPMLQTYFELAKLLRRGAVYSRTTTWVFRLAPAIELAAVMLTVALVPLGGMPAMIHFTGDFLLLVYLLAIVRFFTILAALDTGSSFEGMGASREAQFSALAEPALLLALVALSRATGGESLTSIYAALTPQVWLETGGGVALVATALFMVFLTETARMPFDDPGTHLEVTMIHEVMILDHGGPDLALIELASILKVWTLGSLLVGVLLPVHAGNAALDAALGVVGLVALAVVVGGVASNMARLRLLRVPQLLLGGAVLAVCGLFLVVSAGGTP